MARHEVQKYARVGAAMFKFQEDCTHKHALLGLSEFSTSLLAQPSLPSIPTHPDKRSTTKQQKLKMDVIEHMSAPTLAQTCKQVQTSALMISALMHLSPGRCPHAQEYHWPGCQAAQQGTRVMYEMYHTPPKQLTKPRPLLQVNTACP